MPHIGFIGLGNMGGPMAANLVKAGEQVLGFDVVPASREASARDGVQIVANAKSCVENAGVVISMLPAGEHVLSVWNDILPAANQGALFIDCSTIDVASARKAHKLAAERGVATLDAPVSGGVGGAKAATLTFMVGGSQARVRTRQAGARAHGQARRALRRAWQRSGGENLQQHDPRHLDDRGERGVRAGREARPLASGFVRRRFGLFRPMLVADQLLPGAGTGPRKPGEQRLQAGLRRGLDAQGSKACPRSRALGQGQNRTRRAGRRHLRALRASRATAAPIFPRSSSSCAGSHKKKNAAGHPDPRQILNRSKNRTTLPDRSATTA